jgi:hypothetical protein
VKELVEFPVDGEDSVVFVEVDDADSTAGYTRVAMKDPDAVAGRATTTFQQALAPLRPAVDAILEKFTKLAVRPETVELQFGIKLTGKAGAVFAAAEAEGQLQVKLVWMPKPSPSGATNPEHP